MAIAKLTGLAVLVSLAATAGTSAFAEGKTVNPAYKSTQAAPVPVVPPVPPWITAAFGPNAALVVGTVGIPGIVVATVVIAGVVYSVVVDPASGTSSTSST